MEGLHVVGGSQLKDKYSFPLFIHMLCIYICCYIYGFVWITACMLLLLFLHQSVY
jgi:hypothetical protein